MEDAMLQTNILNPLTWGNLIVLAVNLMSLMEDLPATFHSIIVDMVSMTGIIPAWSVWVVETLILAAIIFAVIEMLQGNAGGA
jgi:hypothetical protein